MPRQICVTRLRRPRRCTHKTNPGRLIDSVILTGAEIDQIAGLLTLGEETRVTLYATAATQMAIEANPIFAALAQIERCTVAHGSVIRLAGGLQAEPFAVPGKVPLHLEDPNSEGRVEVSGVALSDGRSSIVVVPGASAITPTMLTRLLDAKVVLFDVTLFEDDELLKLSAGAKTGRRMGRIPISGADGSLQRLSELTNRRIYIHFNNTNPIHVWIAATRAGRSRGTRVCMSTALQDLPTPSGLVAELTHCYPLTCPYCSAPLRLDPRADELASGTWKRVFSEAAASSDRRMPLAYTVI